MKLTKLQQLLLALVLVTIATLTVVIWQWPDQNIHLVMCDVGQGDAFLITHGFRQVLIDTGLNDAVLNCLFKHVPIWDRKLELLVITHGDNDHSGGMAAVFGQYAVANILTNAAVVQKLTVLGLFKASFLIGQSHQLHRSLSPKLLQPKVGDCLNVDEKMKFCLASPDLSQIDMEKSAQSTAETILSASGQPISGEVEDNNSESIVLIGHLDKIRVALMGDLPATEELALLQKGMIEPVDILKVGHHGSKNSTNTRVAQKMSPEVSLLSVGKNNRYGHPAPEILTSLTELGSKIYRTDKDGEVEVVIGADQYWVSRK